MTTQSAEPTDETTHAISLLRDQVDALQIANAEKRKAWYRQSSAIMSMVALIVSFTFSALSVHFRSVDQRSGDEAAKVTLLRQNIIGLAELSVEMTEASNRLANNPALYSQLSGNQNAKREMLIEETERLISNLGDRVTSAEYLTFGQQIALDSRFDRANQYFQKALSAAPSDIARVAAYRSLAMAAMQPGKGSNRADGRRYWADALRLLSDTADQYSLFLASDILLNWALLEQRLGSGEIADSLLAEARTISRRVLPGPNRAQLDARLAAPFPIASGSTTAVADASSLIGDWLLHFSDGRGGTLTFVPGGMLNGASAVQATVTSAGKAVELRNGSVVIGAGTVLITWGIQRAAGSGPPTFTSANTRLRLDGATLLGDDEPLGEATTRLTAVRASGPTRRQRTGG
jgi:tetratricopeptide (TPR) repeat protein